MRWEPTLHFHCARHFSVVFNLHSYSLRYALISPFFRWKNRIPEILYAFFGHTPTTVALSDSNSSKFYFIVAHHNVFPKTSLYAFCVVEITPHSCGYLNLCYQHHHHHHWSGKVRGFRDWKLEFQSWLCYSEHQSLRFLRNAYKIYPTSKRCSLYTVHLMLLISQK